ncbi:MAG: hypothetical protein FIA97_07130 [Methylococcaceae bacterium]|nr:hypothetical protein [Methylococcaceae bacterium]
MNGHERLSRWATTANLGLTAASLAILAAGLVTTYCRPPTAAPAPVLDQLQAAILWSYIIATPLCATAALLLAPARTGRIRINYWLLALWGAFMIWTGTMPL